jgi:hypothetical protein
MAKIPVSFSRINLPPPTSYIVNNALTTNNPLSQYKRVGGGFVAINPKKKSPNQHYQDGTIKNPNTGLSNFSNKQFTAESVHSVSTNPQFRKLLAKQQQRKNQSL